MARTPILDQFAAEGMRFTNAFTTAGVCVPNRASIITGMHPSSIGAHHMRTPHEAPGLPTPYSAVPPPHVKAFTEYLRDAGYFPTNNGKTDYTFETGEDPYWRLYDEPLRIDSSTTIRAKAIRYGYEESDERVVDIVVEEPGGVR